MNLDGINTLNDLNIHDIVKDFLPVFKYCLTVEVTFEDSSVTSFSLEYPNDPYSELWINSPPGMDCENVYYPVNSPELTKFLNTFTHLKITSLKTYIKNNG